MNLKKGITLIEMIIYVGILVIVLGLTANLFYQIATYRVNQRIENTLFENSSFIIDKITKDVKRAESIESPAGSSFSDQIQLTLDGETVNWVVEDGVLKRNEVQISENNVNVDLSNSGLGFRRINNTMQIKMLLRTKQKRFGRPEKEKVYKTTIFLNE